MYTLYMQTPSMEDFLYDPDAGIGPWTFIETRTLREAYERASDIGINVNDCCDIGDPDAVDLRGINYYRWQRTREVSDQLIPERGQLFTMPSNASTYDLLSTPVPGIANKFPTPYRTSHAVKRHLELSRPLCFVHPLNRPFYSAFADIKTTSWRRQGWAVNLRLLSAGKQVFSFECDSYGNGKSTMEVPPGNASTAVPSNRNLVAHDNLVDIPGAGTLVILPKSGVHFYTEDHVCALACERALRRTNTPARSELRPGSVYIDTLIRKIALNLLRGPAD